jgi:hypothetical protein
MRRGKNIGVLVWVPTAALSHDLVALVFDDINGAH